MNKQNRYFGLTTNKKRLTKTEKIMLAIRSCLHRLANMDVRDDVREGYQRELRHWRLELVKLRIRQFGSKVV